MTITAFSARTACALVLIVNASAFAQTPAPLAEPVRRRIDSVFAAYTRNTAPGCATAVVRDGQIVFAKGYGMSDLQHGIPITPASIFHVASISKQFTAMSIVLLAQDGKLNLDDDIRKHLPEVPDFGHVITIRHLIHHTSGLRDQWQLLNLSGWRADDPKSEADILWLVSRQRALNFDPGEEHLYSNTGYTLLGTIVQRVSGKTLREFTTERIFTPLGMTNTHFHDDHTMIVPGRTSAYVPRGGGRGGAANRDDYAISIPVFDNAGATSLFATVQDMAKWDRNFIEPKVGTAATITQMEQRGKLNDGTEIPYAFALSHGEMRGLRVIGHGGADAGYRSDYLRFPDQHYAFATFCNVGTANPAQLSRDVAAIVLADKMTPVASGGGRGNATAPVTEVPIDSARVRALAGLYIDRKTESGAEAVYRDSTKSLHAGRAPNAPRLVHVGNNEFVMTAPNGQQSRYRFATNTVVNLAAPNIVLGRVPPPVKSREHMSGFAGRYRSDELDVEWTIDVVNDSTIRLQRRRAPDQRLISVWADGFNGGIGTVRFTRDATGRVDGLLLSAGRVRHLRFDKQGARSE
jgi:CubicO group peptidase (beta-lactamase class C family)